ncbi:rhodanese-like domain-containing protein [Brevifollis gellanilyticus]|uniref:Sulfurtransferase n=1 Tax=Brevifollis gellanilyticus TaxID=748831 RepID=A0A512M6D0_9BACT|nr:rhodanese-like domain-containing protein [Brevifollis gellanilyticus]GEP42284.1 sulfurtransferase [Brevifollis gellanilyticus]
MATISPVALHELLQDKTFQNVIDVRTPVEFAEVHVDSAKNVPLDSLKPDELHDTHRLSIEKPIYILCRSGQRATKAADQLAKAGYPNSIVVEGGTLAWIAAGLPVNRGKTKVIGLERQVRIAAGTLVLSGVLLSYFVNPAFIWLSGFVGAGLIFAGITDWCGMGLLLAKAPWNQKA